MNPYPFVGLNHFTVPVATITLHCSHYGLTIIRQSADTGYGSKYKKLENPMVIAAATETSRGKRAHAVVAHVGEGHGGWSLHRAISLAVLDDPRMVMKEASECVNSFLPK